MSSNAKQAKIALITGAAQRLGAGIARKLHQQGINTIIHYRHSKDAAESLCAELNSQRPQSAAALQADLSQLEALPILIEMAVNVWGHLDILINNASCFFRTPMGQVTEEQWNILMDTNVKAPFFLAQAAAPFLQSSSSPTIINITDIHASKPLRDFNAYCISKAALSMLTKTLAKELAPHIRVNAIAPGAVAWPEGNNALDEPSKAKIIQRTALKKHGSAEDIAAAAWFLVEQPFITGETITVDGGRFI